MTTLGIIGAGHIGSQLARAAVSHGGHIARTRAVTQLEANVAKAERHIAWLFG